MVVGGGGDSTRNALRRLFGRCARDERCSGGAERRLRDKAVNVLAQLGARDRRLLFDLAAHRRLRRSIARIFDALLLLDCGRNSLMQRAVVVEEALRDVEAACSGRRLRVQMTVAIGQRAEARQRHVIRGDLRRVTLHNKRVRVDAKWKVAFLKFAPILADLQKSSI